jgi:hypothetical protein
MRMNDFLQTLFSDACESPEAVREFFRIFEEPRAKRNQGFILPESLEREPKNLQNIGKGEIS